MLFMHKPSRIQHWSCNGMMSSTSDQLCDHAGSRLLEVILQLAAATPAVAEVYLHVHIINEDALAFYQKWGFQNAGVVQNYYRRIEPRDAVLLRRLT